MDPDEMYGLMRNLASPLVAVTSSWKGKKNGMISNTALRGSLIPSAPRLLVFISKRNLSHSLIWESGSFALHLLRADQMDLVWKLGFFSGADTEKLEDVEYVMKSTGSPILKDVYAYFDCKIMNAMDSGYGTCFLADVVDGGQLTEGEIMTSNYFRKNMPEKWRPAYEEQLVEAQNFAEQHVKEIDYAPWRGGS